MNLVKIEVPGVREDDANICIRNGMLNVTLAKSKKAKPRQINVSVS